MDKYVMDIRLKHWITIFEAQARSGLNKRTFCKQHGISKGVFFRWQRILRDRVAEGFDPSSIASPEADEKKSEDIKDESPVFYEITPVKPCSLTETDKPLRNPTQEVVTPAPDNSFEAIISYKLHQADKLQSNYTNLVQFILYAFYLTLTYKVIKY